MTSRSRATDCSYADVRHDRLIGLAAANLCSAGGTQRDEEATMARRVRKWMTVFMTAVVTGVLVLLPTAAMAGIVVTGID